MQTIVIGHQKSRHGFNLFGNRLCRTEAQNWEDRISFAARAGNTNERIDLVLQKFGVPAPKFMSDVSPRSLTSWRRRSSSVAHDSSIYQAMNSIEQKRIRGLPVVDADDRCLGLLSGWKVSQFLFPQREEAPGSREIFASISDIAHSFDGQFIVGAVRRIAQQKVVLMVAAMSLASFGERLRRYSARSK